MDMCMIYATIDTENQALALGGMLVEERLAACVNIIPGMRSIYRWQGVVEEADEMVVLVKTRKDYADKVIARIREVHPAEVPAVLVLPILKGNPAFFDWIARETSPAEKIKLPPGVDAEVYE
jgi:periplasmic divalent cation tolerance protein